MEETQLQNQPEMVENISENQPSVVENPSKEDIKDRNFNALRKQIEDAERRAAEAERRAEHARQSYGQAQVTQSLPVDDENYGDPEDYVPVKTLSKATKKFKSELSEQDKKMQEMERKLAYLEAKTATADIKDYNEVVNEDNLKTLQRLYPEDYEVVVTATNAGAKSKAAYNMIKNYGISQVRTEANYKAIEKKIEINRNKPTVGAMAPSSSSPLSKFSRYDADGRLQMTEDDAKRIQADMRRKMGVGT